MAKKQNAYARMNRMMKIQRLVRGGRMKHKRPLSAYNRFVKSHMAAARKQSRGDPQRAMQIVAALWRRHHR